MGTENLFHKHKARQENEIKRQQARRDSFERVLIVCEDSKSCPSYLRAIRDELKLTNIVIRPNILPNAEDFKWDSKPAGVVKYALGLKKKDKKGYDRVYCVIDRDTHDSFQDALKTAQKNNIAVIVSIPCLEYWLLLHFEYMDRCFQAAQGSNCGKVIKVLKKYLSDYEKGKEFLKKHYSVLKERPAIAIEHAKRRERDCQPPSEESAACEKQRQCQLDELEKMNPYTEMHWLIECLMEMKNKKDEVGINN